MRANLIALILLFTLSSCAYRIIDYTTISSKNTNMIVDEESKGDRVVGSHFVLRFFWIPFGTPSLKEATNRAIENAGKQYDQLIDGEVTYRVKWFLFFSYVGYEVEGTPIVSYNINKDRFSKEPTIRTVEKEVMVHDTVFVIKEIEVNRKNEVISSNVSQPPEPTKQVETTYRPNSKKAPQKEERTIVNKPEYIIQFLTSRYSDKSFPNLKGIGTVIAVPKGNLTIYQIKVDNPSKLFDVRSNFPDAFLVE